jgi:hypothetical protein
MVDELLMAAQHRGLRLRYPGECVWTLVRSDDHQFECALHSRRGSGDWLGMMYMDGGPLGGRLFMLRAEAVEWAARERLAFTENGDVVSCFAAVSCRWDDQLNTDTTRTP